jgi:Tfp pilus assembly protein PilO
MLKFPLDKYDMLEPGEAVEVAIICMLIVFAILVIIYHIYLMEILTFSSPILNI